MKELPGVKTFEQYGYEGCYVMSWHGLSVSSKTPKPVLSKIREAFASTCKDPEFVEALYKTGYFLKYLDHEQYNKFITAEIAKFSEMKKEGIKVTK